MKANWLINPFERIAGWQSLVVGLLVMSVTAVVGKINGVFFDGVLDVHSYPHTYMQGFLAQLIDWGVLFLVLWIAGRLFSKSKIRMIDVAGTVALARAPFLLISLAGFLPIVPVDPTDMGSLLAFGLLAILIIIWVIALMYKAYAVSCNLSGKRGVLSFIGALLVAEIISKVLIYFLLSGSSFVVPGSQASTTEALAIPEGQAIHQTAVVVTDALKMSDTDAVWAYFDEPMKKALPKEKWQATWASITTTHGQLKNADTSVEAKEHNGYQILIMPCSMERGTLDLQLVFNHEGRISGLYFK